jgi:hypothetical protein
MGRATAYSHDFGENSGDSEMQGVRVVGVDGPGTLFQLAISPFSWMDAAMEGVGVCVGQMMETEAAREPEEQRPKRKSLSMEDLRRKYSWWPSVGGKEEQPAPLIDVEAGEEVGATLRGVKSTKL